MAEPSTHAQADRSPPDESAPDGSRRGLLRRLTLLLGGILGGALTLPAALMLSDPLRRRGAAAAPVPVARSRDVPDLDRGDAPLRAVVVARAVVDAWSRSDTVRQGAVWLYRQRGELVCLSSLCPHAGCAIDFDADHRRFRCPCHDSSFGLDGARQTGPAPRGMDRLETAEKDDHVLVRFVRFRPGRATKEAL